MVLWNTHNFPAITDVGEEPLYVEIALYGGHREIANILITFLRASLSRNVPDTCPVQPKKCLCVGYQFQRRVEVGFGNHSKYARRECFLLQNLSRVISKQQQGHTGHENL
jgi:hypothetical protein